MTSTETQVKRGPGRPRKDESRPERRRKKRSGAIEGRRLGVDTELLDRANYAYRIVNDRPGRLVDFNSHDDWDFVTNDGGAVSENSSDLGARVSWIVGTGPDGQPLRAYLMRKPKSFYDEDQADKAADLDEQINQLRRGMSRSGEAQGDYVPSGGIRIGE